MRGDFVATDAELWLFVCLSLFLHMVVFTYTYIFVCTHRSIGVLMHTGH